MRCISQMRIFSGATILLLGVVLALPAVAGAPMCNQAAGNPALATCTCVCEASSNFAGCVGLPAGANAATPDQCPDMLQGRRVLSRGDALAASFPIDPDHSPGGQFVRNVLQDTRNDPNNEGLGMVTGAPTYQQTSNYCDRAPGSLQPQPSKSRLVRMFDLPYSHVMLFAPTSTIEGGTDGGPCADNDSFTLQFSNPHGQSGPVPESVSSFTTLEYAQLAIDDFNDDGFDDVLVLTAESITLLSAVDPAHPSQGVEVKWFSGTVLPEDRLRAPLNEPTTGDFNGDGLLDVAWIGGNFPNGSGDLSVYFATVCPGAVPGSVICEGNSVSAFDVVLDPAEKLVSGATSTIVLEDASLTPSSCGVVGTLYTGTYGLPQPGSFRAGAVALGNFADNGINNRGAPIDELVIAYVSGTGDAASGSVCKTNVSYWSFITPRSGSGWARQVDAEADIFNGNTAWPRTISSRGYPYINLFAQAARLDWFGKQEQAVIVMGGAIPVQNSAQQTVRAVIAGSVTGSGDSADLSLCFDLDNTSSDRFLRTYGATVGRFSTSTTVDDNGACLDFAGAEPGACPYNPQIALLLGKEGANPNFPGNQRQFNLYSVRASDPGGSGPKCGNDPNVSGFLAQRASTAPAFANLNPVIDWRQLAGGGNLLDAGDAFGRSVRVGVPFVTRISQHTQPEIVIQAPPSLIDYVQPNSSDSLTPAIVNFTRAPSSYQATIDFDTSSQDSSSSQSSQSYSFSTTESASGEFKTGFPDAFGVDVKISASSKNFHQSTNTQQLGAYSIKRLQTGAGVGVDDQLWWTQTSFNVFHFPVLGETSCPANLTCDPANPNTTGCTAGAAGVPLSCAESGNGCLCTSASATASLCPAVPSQAARRACATSGDDVCCTQQPNPLNVSFSGPQETVRSSSPGASVEWYQPRHEPGQILSYPHSQALLQGRWPGEPQVLGALDAFSTGTNNTSQATSWTCVESSSISNGSSIQHSNDDSISITAGTPELSKKTNGIDISGGFDYQNSSSTGTLNTSSVGLTSASSVKLSLDGAGFLDPTQYSYSVEALILGAVKPPSVFDEPVTKVCPSDNANCGAAEQIQSDCTTTGPITVAFASDPTTSTRGLWWQATSPYLTQIDVALNNPVRWRRVNASQVDDTDLQCRGGTCYTGNQPPTTASAQAVWGAPFYSMKGLLVTNDLPTGPQRDVATAGDTIYLQARIYNYSLRAMSAGSRVFARFYRQQIDVNNNNGSISVLDYAQDANGAPLPAVPIGPGGLGDSTPVQVSALPGFNTTDIPANDNMKTATISYTTEAADRCEWDNGQQVCDGAYYAYWVTVWAEDLNGNVLSELTGHGLGSGFDPATPYDFITDVPLETVSSQGSSSSSFSNNVGMYKKVFAILPDEDLLAQEFDAQPAQPAPAQLSIDRQHIAPFEGLLGEPVLISAQVASAGGALPGTTVLFYDDDPESGAPAFDTEFLPHIRAGDAHFVQASYNPVSCGTHEIFMRATHAYGLTDTTSLLVDVGVDPEQEIAFLIDQVRKLTLSFDNAYQPAAMKASLGSMSQESRARKARLALLRQLRLADRDYQTGRTRKAELHIERFMVKVGFLDALGRIEKEPADLMLGQAQQLLSCT